MAPTLTHASSSHVLVVGDTGGVTVVNPSTPLKRLNYFDGKFLRASDFEVEQQYLRHLVALSNQGLGAGVVYGYDTTLGSGDDIEIGPGLAIDPAGNVLLLQSAVSQNIQALIEKSRASSASISNRSPHSAEKAGGFSDCIDIAAPPPTTVVPVSDIYVIAICTAEALCGQADVFGKLCEEACVTSTDRPYRLDGIVLRAIPLQLVTPFPESKVPIGGNIYLRSKVAHSWYTDEVRKHPNAISRAGLLSEVWCVGAGYDDRCCEVPLAVVARAGSTTIFLDAWIVRRERMDAPARRYWQWKMRMRPWDVFLAQILQFQCQLAELLDGVPTPGGRGTNPCEPHRVALQDAAEFVEQIRSGLASVRSVPISGTLADRPALLAISMTKVADLQEKLHRVISSGLVVAPRDRMLIRGGIIELPPAGYLPVINRSDVTVNDQVRALLGDGLDLRFCITTVDYIAHAVEEAQHMDRISLLQGIDDPANTPHVDILVPDGKPLTARPSKTGVFGARMAFSAEQTGGLIYEGAAREDAQATGGSVLSFAAAGLSQTAVTKLQVLAKAFANPKASARARTLTPDFTTNEFVMKPKMTGAKLDTVIANAASAARTFSAGTMAASKRESLLAANERLVAATGSVDGLWLTARADRDIGSLAVDEHAAVSFRAVIGSRPPSPTAIDLTFNGTLSITEVASGPVLTGTLTGIVSAGILKEQEAVEKATELLLTERYHAPVKITYSGDSDSGTAALDLPLGGGGKVLLRLTRTASGPSLPVTYEAHTVATTAAPAASTPLGQLRLTPDAGIVDPSNRLHQYAESGLDLVQAAFIVSEPLIKGNAGAVLFPPQGALTKELPIEAIHDWVAFTRRREVNCGVAVAPPPPPAPPRIYRVLNVTAKNEDEAKKLATTFSDQLQHPDMLAAAIQRLLTQAERQDTVKLFVKFSSGTATAESDLAAAESDWKTFNPGASIVYAAAGAVGETDGVMQVRRIDTLEAAIAPDSRESAATKEEAIVPYPPAAVPAGADGIMLFITMTTIVVRNALLLSSKRDGPEHFPDRGSDNETAFDNNVPRGNTLRDYTRALTAPVFGVTLATTKAAPDPGAAVRLSAVSDALAAAGHGPAPPAARLVTVRLSDHDRRVVTELGLNPDDFDEVIFFEVN